MRALEVDLAGVTTDPQKTQASWPRLPELSACRQPQPQPRAQSANQIWNWVTGSSLQNMGSDYINRVSKNVTHFLFEQGCAAWTLLKHFCQ